MWALNISTIGKLGGAKKFRGTTNLSRTLKKKCNKSQILFYYSPHEIDNSKKVFLE